MKKVNIPQITSIILICIVLTGCSKDDETSITGTYIFSMIEASNCSNPASNYVLDFQNQDCGTAFGFEFCQSGTMNFSAEGTVTSTLRLVDNFSGLGLGISYNGQGTYVLNNDILTVCINNCEDFRVSGSTLIGEAKSGGCDGRVVLRKI